MFKNEWGGGQKKSRDKSILREIAGVFGPEFKKMWKNLNENANLEIDGHPEEVVFPDGGQNVAGTVVSRKLSMM